ncbi:MAG: hypothetical protein Q4E05_05990 [Pseudoclavibacter sp.]|nr:hypothetical protein [Pseudoclavibacter sp.]
MNHDDFASQTGTSAPDSPRSAPGGPGPSVPGGGGFAPGPGPQGAWRAPGPAAPHQPAVYPAPSDQNARAASVLSVIAVVAGAVSVLPLNFLLVPSMTAIVCSILALVMGGRVAPSGRPAGFGTAVTGLVLGCIGFGLSFLFKAGLF